jgi:hypothetical protein
MRFINNVLGTAHRPHGSADETVQTERMYLGIDSRGIGCLVEPVITPNRFGTVQTVRHRHRLSTISPFGVALACAETLIKNEPGYLFAKRAPGIDIDARVLTREDAAHAGFVCGGLKAAEAPSHPGQGV